MREAVETACNWLNDENKIETLCHYMWVIKLRNKVVVFAATCNLMNAKEASLNNTHYPHILVKST